MSIDIRIKGIEERFNNYENISEGEYIDIEIPVRLAAEIPFLISTIRSRTAMIEALHKENSHYKNTLKYFADNGSERAKDVLKDFEL
jgi:hypothetical protein